MYRAISFILENFEAKGGRASNYILNLFHVSKKSTYMYLRDALKETYMIIIIDIHVGVLINIEINFKKQYTLT